MESLQAATPLNPGTNINLAPDDVAALVELLKSCNTEVEASHKAQTDKDALVKKQSEDIVLLNQQLVDIKTQNSGIVNNPTFWLITGALLVGTLHTLLK